MPDTNPKVADGDIIEYARKNAGGLLVFPGGGGWHLVPGEQITVGRDIPVDLSNRLLEVGRCKIVTATSPKASDAVKPSKKAADAPAVTPATPTVPAAS